LAAFNSNTQADLLGLEEIETRLSNLLHQDRANWMEMARLAILVQQHKLYKQRGFRSFTRWIKETARVNDRQPSLLWLNIKAARYYLKLRQLSTDDLNQITEAKAAPEALATLEKIERQAPPPVFEVLKSRVLAGEATVQECRRIERDYRPAAVGMTNRGRPQKGQEGSLEQMGVWKQGNHFPAAAEVEEATSQTIEVEALAIEVAIIPEPLTTSVTITRNQVASTIKRSLSSSSEWAREAAQMRYPPRFWSTHTEVRVSTSIANSIDEVSNRSRGRLRLDLLAVLRWSLKLPKDLIGVEIKSCLADFKADKKWEEYLDFCHYFCFAIPAKNQELLASIESCVPKSIGILGVDLSASLHSSNLSYPVQVIRKPQKQKAEKISLVYETLYERVLGWSGSDESNHNEGNDTIAFE